LLRVAVVVELFNNDRHTHVATLPPIIWHAESKDELLAMMGAGFGQVVSYHYRDHPGKPAQKVGWIFQIPSGGGETLEIWTSVLDPDTLKYLDLDAL